MCPWPLGTLQAQPLVCEVRNGRAPHSTPAEGAVFWPDFRQNCRSPPKVFHGWGWIGEDPPVLVCLAGCPRTPHYNPRPLDAVVVPSILVPHHTVRAERPEIGRSPCRKLAFSMARRGGCVGREVLTHVGKGLPMCPWPLGTLQAQPLVCEVRNGRASHSTPAEGAEFWPDFRQNCGTLSKGVSWVGMERGGSTGAGVSCWMPQDPT